MRLFAKWACGEDPSEVNPYLIKWEDGSIGTLEDYAEHYADHQTMLLDSATNEITLILFTDEVADVRFDYYVQRWIYTTPGKEEFTLDLSDHDASDDDINKAISEQIIFLPDPSVRRRAGEAKGAAG